MKNSKGIEPLIATVLLIAFTVAVAGIISIWVKGFTTTTTNQVDQMTNTTIFCSSGGIAISNVNFCSTRSELSGKLTNTGLIDLIKITLQEAYLNGSSPTQPLCISGSSVVSCSASNLTIKPGFIYTFNISGVTSGFEYVNTITDCASVGAITKTWTAVC